MPNPYASNLASLLRQRGSNEALNYANQGQIWGAGVQQIGSIASDTIKGMLQAREDEKAKALRDEQAKEALHGIRGTQTERALQQAGVKRDTETYQSELRAAGYPELAEKSRLTAKAEREATAARTLQTVSAYSTVAGQSAEALRRVREDPSQWAVVQPFLKEKAGLIDPSLAAKIPETYDPDEVERLLTMATDTEGALTQKANALKAIQANNALGQANLSAAQQQEQWKALTIDLLDDSVSKDDLDANVEHARTSGVPESVIENIKQKLGTWTTREDMVQRLGELSMSPADKRKLAEEGIPSSAHPEVWNLFLENKERVEGELREQGKLPPGQRLTIKDAMAMGLYDEAIGRWGDTRRTGQQQTDKVNDPYWDHDRKDYEDALERYATETANPDPTKPPPQHPGPFRTWRWRNTGRGTPDRESPEVLQQAMQYLKAEAARRAQVPGSKPIRTDEAAARQWLNLPSNRRLLKIE